MSPVGKTENEGRSICMHKNSCDFNGPHASVCASNDHSDSSSLDTKYISCDAEVNHSAISRFDVQEANSCPDISPYAAPPMAPTVTFYQFLCVMHCCHSILAND